MRHMPTLCRGDNMGANMGPMPMAWRRMAAVFADSARWAQLPPSAAALHHGGVSGFMYRLNSKQRTTPMTSFKCLAPLRRSAAGLRLRHVVISSITRFIVTFTAPAPKGTTRVGVQSVNMVHVIPVWLYLEEQ